jgi:hypothetical protein
MKAFIHTVTAIVLLVLISFILSTCISWIIIYARNESCNYNNIIDIYSRYQYWFSLGMLTFLVMVPYPDKIVSRFIVSNSINIQAIDYSGRGVALLFIVYGNFISQNPLSKCL